MAVVIDPDTAEEGGEELALHSPVGGDEQRIRAFHEVQVAEDHVCALVELFVGGGEGVLEVVLLDLHLTQATAKRVSGEGAVCGEVDEAFFFHVELLQLLGEPDLLLLL